MIYWPMPRFKARLGRRNPVFRQLVPEGADAYAEYPGRVGAVALGFVQGLADEPALHFLDGHKAGGVRGRGSRKHGA